MTLFQGRLGTTITQTAIQPPTAVDLPSGAFDQRIEFSISPLPDKGNAYGWTYWKDLGFELTRS